MRAWVWLQMGEKRAEISRVRMEKRETSPELVRALAEKYLI